MTAHAKNVPMPVSAGIVVSNTMLYMPYNENEGLLCTLSDDNTDGFAFWRDVVKAFRIQMCL
jgi:hypothetical protein